MKGLLLRLKGAALALCCWALAWGLMGSEAVAQTAAKTPSRTADPAATAPVFWSYLAEYAEGRGLTRVNLSAMAEAPRRSHRWLLMPQISFLAQPDTGLPEVQDLGFLNGILESLLTDLGRQQDVIYVGSFSLQGLQKHYLYVRDLEKIEGQVLASIRRACITCRGTVGSREDPEWDTYFRFILPNKTTVDLHQAELKALGFWWP